MVAVHNLAWFASTTHLATLDGLGSYFRSQKTILIVRTFAIVIFLLLLDFVFIIRAFLAMNAEGWFFPDVRGAIKAHIRILIAIAVLFTFVGVKTVCLICEMIAIIRPL